MKPIAAHLSLPQAALLLLLSVLWGGSFLFVGIAIKELPPLTLVLARVALAALILVPVVYALGQRLPSEFKAWRPFVVMAMINNVIPFTLIAMGQQQIASGLASVLNATTPLFTLLAALVFAGERLASHKLTGVVLGIGGVALLVGPEAMFGRASSALSMVMLLGAALCYGISGIWARRLRDTHPVVTATSQLICSTIVLLPLTALIDEPWRLPMPSSDCLVAVSALASASTALAYIVFFRIMVVSGPMNVMLVTLLIPVAAIPLGAWWFGEVLLASHFAGAAVIALSLVVIDGRLAQLFRR